MLHVAKTPKPLEKIAKADQVTVPEDEALKNNLEKHNVKNYRMWWIQL